LLTPIRSLVNSCPDKCSASGHNSEIYDFFILISSKENEKAWIESNFVEQNEF